MRPYAIWIGGWFHMSGGIRALHQLKQEILNRGGEARMTYEGGWQRDWIMVYPEIVHTNPEGAENIVRWKLNQADLPNDGLTVAWESGMGEHPLLTVDIMEPDLWRPLQGPRSGVGFWVGKGAADMSQVPEGAIEVTRGNYTTRVELAQFLGTLDYFISFDPFSAINVEAACAGTPVLILGEHPLWTRAKFEEHGWVKHGVAWSWDELGQAKDEANLAYWDYQHKRREFTQRIDRFVTLSQEMFH